MDTPRIETFLHALGKTSLEAGVVVLLVAAAHWVFRKQLAPRWRSALWILVVARLLLPFSFSSATSVFNLMPALPQPKAAMPAQISSQVTAAKNSTLQLPHSATSPAMPEAHNPPTAQPQSAWNWPMWLFGFWLIGAIFLSMHVLVCSLRFWRKCINLQPLGDPATLALLKECCERAGIHRCPDLFESDAVSSPALHGLFHPRLLLPTGFTGKFSPPELRYVFLHELAHLKRRDLPLNWVMVALQAAHWFNPLVWLGFSRWRADRELACDAMALEIAGQQQSREYGRTILRLLETAARPIHAPGLVGILEDKRQLRRRIEMIAGYIPARGWPLVALALTAGLAAVGLTDAKTSNDQQKSYDMKMTNTIARAGVIGMLALASPTTLTSAADADAAQAKLAQDLIGTWVLVGEPGKVEKAPKEGGRYKFFTGTHWCITQADPDNGVVVFHHGGSYKLEGGEYIESVEYANPTTMNRIGRTNHFKIEIENGMLTDIGVGNPWREVWKRVESKTARGSSPFSQGLIGEWEITESDGKSVSGDLRSLKLITDSSWCDTSADVKNGVVVYHHGGFFTLKGNRYVQKLLYANPATMQMIGNSAKFDIKLDGDTLNLDGIGNPWKEVWKRVK